MDSELTSISNLPPPPPSRYPMPKNRSRSKGLRKLGVTEDDVHLASRLLEQIPACPCDPNKAERIFGYASTCLAREKALRLLGATEDDIALENAKNLGSLGVAGRRRSFSIIEQPNKPILPRRRHTVNSPKEKPRRRSSTDKHGGMSKKEIKLLRNQAKSSADEIEALKARIEELEKRLIGTAVEPG